MAAPSTPPNFNVQTANGQILSSWSSVAGATAYLLLRSTDNSNFTLVYGNLPTEFLDTSVTLGTQYYYKVIATNGVDSSPATAFQSAVPTTSGELCLSQIRLMAQQRADRVNSNFVTMPEWNSYINQSLFELYDLLVTCYEDYFMAPMITFSSNGTSFLYPLPNGVLSFTGPAGTPITAAPFYKLLGVDLGLNTANNAFVTVNKFNFIDRNKFVYPNTASTIYGVFNLRYRLMGNQIEFIPTPSAGQIIRIAYIPRLVQLLQDTDITTMGTSGWIEYAIVRAAKYALDKEESDTTKLDGELTFLKARIEESAMNRDAGQPDTISNVRSGFFNGGLGWGGGNGSVGGW